MCVCGRPPSTCGPSWLSYLVSVDDSPYPFLSKSVKTQPYLAYVEAQCSGVFSSPQPFSGGLSACLTTDNFTSTNPPKIPVQNEVTAYARLLDTIFLPAEGHQPLLPTHLVPRPFPQEELAQSTPPYIFLTRLNLRLALSAPRDRWLALGQGLRRPLPALEAVQREALELWRCFLSYGVDVAAADTVVLVARGQGWLPGLGVAPPAIGGAGAGAGAGVNAGGVGGGGSVVGGVGGRLPPRLAFYRALHQLACACVLPPGGKNTGRKKGADTDIDIDAGGGGGGGKADGRDSGGAGEKPAGAAAVLSLGGVEVVPESWADVGDTVDAAVEAAILWLSGERGGGAGTDGAAETAARALQVRGRRKACAGQ